MKKYLIIFLLLSTQTSLFSQQDMVVSQYMFNGLLLNPAYAGSKQYFSSTLLYRNQWTGWKGAPQTGIFTLHGRLRDQVSGLGLTISNDRLGITNQSDAYVNYAYHIHFNDEKHSLSFGLKGGFSYYTADFNKLVYWDEDQVYQKPRQTNLIPNAGTGAYFYSDRFYAGISVPHLISYDPRESFSLGNDFSTVPAVRRHYDLTAGYAIEFSNDVIAKPSILVKYVASAPVQADFNLNFLLKRVLWVGGSYRTGDSFVGMIEIQATPRFRLGYAYDYTLTSIGNYSYGSHEIMIGYDFNYDKIKMKTPRYF